MQFEFDQELMANGLIEIPEIGEFAIEAENGEGFCFYLIVRTLLGMTMFATCGPVIPDVDSLPSGFAMTLNKMPYDERKVSKNINMFLNDKSHKITKAEIIDIDDAIRQFRELKPYLQNFDKETF